MASQEDLDSVYIGTAFLHSRLSRATRLQVGAVIVTKSGVTLTGYNGSPSGWDNACEDEFNKTLPTTLHAEQNSILKAAREGVSLLGASIYITHAPCVPCAAMIAQAGIKRVRYNKDYRDLDGVKKLRDNGIDIEQLPQLVLN